MAARTPPSDTPTGSGNGASPRKRRGTGGSDPPPPPMLDAFLADEAQRRYLNYALSVITSRALPDVRDGLKPVQRRILYAMQNDLHLSPDAKPKKSARIVGDVHGEVPPARRRRDLRRDGAAGAAVRRCARRSSTARATSAPPTATRPRPCATPRRAFARSPMSCSTSSAGAPSTGAPTTTAPPSEPIVLPARFPHLLVNGSQGIAVGMATSIPPHNLGEVLDACVAHASRPGDLQTAQLLKYIKGPDFPTGGQLHATRKELEAIYETGQGCSSCAASGTSTAKTDGRSGAANHRHQHSLRRRAQVDRREDRRGHHHQEAAQPGRRARRVDRRRAHRPGDEEGRRSAARDGLPLQDTRRSRSRAGNLTCLVPTDNREVATPSDSRSAEMLRDFLDFRFADGARGAPSSTSPSCSKRIHVLEGFEKVFDALDEVIRIIRKSEGKADAAAEAHGALQAQRRAGRRHPRAQALPARQAGDPPRPDASSTRSAGEAKKLEALLKSPQGPLDGRARRSSSEIAKKYGDKRRTKMVGQRRRARVRRGGLHRRRGRQRDPLAPRAGSSACAR